MTSILYRQGDAERLAVVELFEPWKCHFDGNSAAFVETDQGAGAMKLDVNAILPEIDNMWQLRQAVELLHLVVALDPSLIYDVYPTNPSQSANKSMLHAQQKCLLGIRLSAEADNIMEKMEAGFVHSQDVDQGASGSFEAAYNQLTSRLAAARGATWLATMTPVCLDFYVATYSPCFIFQMVYDHSLYDKLVAIKRFGQSLRLAEAAYTTNVSLELAAPPISTRIVNQIQELVHVGIGVGIKQMHLDPTQLTCYNRELGQFLAATMRASSLLSLNVQGYFGIVSGEFLEVVAAHPAIARVAINGSFYDNEVDEHTGRQPCEMMLLNLFDTLLSRPPPAVVGELCWRGYDHLKAISQADLEYSVTQWKATNPSKRLRAKRLWINEIGSPLSCAIAMSLDEVESLQVSNHRATNEKVASVISTMFRNFGRFLKSIDLEKVSITSMDLFAESQLPQLEELRLKAISLQDQSSVERLLSGLARRPGTRERKLEVLQLTGSVLSLDDRLATNLHNALESNRVLHTVTCEMEQNDEIHEKEEPSDAKSALASHHGDVVFAPAKECSSRETKAQRYAFLSVIHSGSMADACRRLDALVVQEIFRFGSKHTNRRIEIR